MVIDKNDTYKNLKKKGFIDSPNKSNDHKYLELRYNNKVVLYTKLSHSSDNDIGNWLIKQMAEQCKLSKQDFIDLVKCPLSKEVFFDKLKSAGIIE